MIIIAAYMLVIGLLCLMSCSTPGKLQKQEYDTLWTHTTKAYDTTLTNVRETTLWHTTIVRDTTGKVTLIDVIKTRHAANLNTNKVARNETGRATAKKKTTINERKNKQKDIRYLRAMAIALCVIVFSMIILNYLTHARKQD